MGRGDGWGVGDERRRRRRRRRRRGKVETVMTTTQ